MFFSEAAFGLSVSQWHDVIQGQYGNIALDGRNATQQGLQRGSEIRQLDRLDTSIFLQKKLLDVLSGLGTLYFSDWPILRGFGGDCDARDAKAKHTFRKHLGLRSTPIGNFCSQDFTGHQ